MSSPHTAATSPSAASQPLSTSRDVSDQPVADELVLGQYIPLLYHYNMLQDEERVGAFFQAIQVVVQPGMHVVELGGGTGILSSFAARRGARVTCVEHNPELVACARRFISDNGLDAQISVIQADAAEFVPSEPVDVVICEMLHVGLLREKQAQIISGFKRAYQRAYGAALPLFIPEVSMLMAQATEHSFDFSGYWAPVPMFQAPLMEQPRTKELSLLMPYASIDYRHEIPLDFDVRQRLTATHSGYVNALRLVTQNVLAVDVIQQRAITWPNQCLVLPLASGLEVNAGEELDVVFRYAAGGSVEELWQSIEIVKPSDRG